MCMKIISIFSLSGKPFPRFGGFSMFEIEDFRRSERLTKDCHRLLPL
jgi:hypothetical protein